MVDNAKFKKNLEFDVIDHFLDEKKVENSKFKTTLTVHAVGIVPNG